MDDLLKEAIADAKAVRETALANAKMALEEAFTPRLKSMLASKIQHEVEDAEEEMEEGNYDEEEAEEGYDEVEDAEEGEHEEGEDAEEVHHEEDDIEAPEAPEAEEEDDDDDDEEEAEEEEGDEDVVEINGVKYARVVSEEEAEEEMEEGEHEEGEHEEEVDELDLESILRELEEEDAEEEVDENMVASDKPDAGDSSGIGQGPEGEGSDEPAGEEGEEEVVDDLQEVEDAEEGEAEEEMDEDIDLEEVLKALSEEEDADEEVEEVANLKQEIKEHRDVVKYLRAKLNEVNLLNAKLLFSNKLFRTFGLTNEQKMKVVETFDRTKNLREIKLVYSTLAESFGQRKPSAVNESKRKGSSSKAVASTKPNKKVISEGEDLKARFKKLANII